ncbi:MAG TPA: hypothetical protein VKA12_11470, partial [Roseiarcus sp.]|nr:hypothetical protein [Roseiarcus sp.]
MLPEEIVTPFRAELPTVCMRPPLAVLSVPPTIVALSTLTVEPVPLAVMAPPVLVIVSKSWSTPPPVASSVPVLVTPPLPPLTLRFTPDAFASTVASLANANAPL